MASNLEALSKQQLISKVSQQSEQLKRYETRLKDVVAAYKGLVKQKEALEHSLNALNKGSEDGADKDAVQALTLSLATLNAEKARSEEAFQLDKKATRDKYESIINTLKEEMKQMASENQKEVENLRAKLTFEMQEREKEHVDHGAMIKEMNMKINTERRSKEKLEDKFVISNDTQETNSEMEKRVRDLSSELEAAQRKLQRAEARTVETPVMLVRLQEKMALLQQSHSLALREEQIKAKKAEEHARKICASQEERVALLEAKLAELSRTVGEYDLQRRRDQDIIKQLKDNLNTQILEKTSSDNGDSQYDMAVSKCETDSEKLADTEYLQNLIEKIQLLRQEIIVENTKLGSPIEIATIFNMSSETLHLQCQKTIDELKNEIESLKAKLSLRKDINYGKEELSSLKEIAHLKAQIKGLEDSTMNLTALLELEKKEKELKLLEQEEKMKEEKNYHKEVKAELEGRIVSLEKQLQTQRDRYAALLEETENYIRSRNDRSRKISLGDELSRSGHVVLQEAMAPPHMLHYVQELARKDLEISQLRKDKHTLEGQLRDTQRDATIEKERFKEVLRNLKVEIDRLHRIQSREGANLEYLKNVVMSYMLSSDNAGRKHMLNAIAAVLHFTDREKNNVFASLR